MANTDTTISAMQIMEKIEMRMFIVERLRIKKAKSIDRMIPV